MPYYTGGEIVSKYLIQEGIKYVIGIPGHGNLPLVDAFFKDKDKIQLIQPKQEMSGVHLAVGYYRITGKPSVVEIEVQRQYPHTGSPAVGWWDVPRPAYLKGRRKQYEEEIKEEKL